MEKKNLLKRKCNNKNWTKKVQVIKINKFQGKVN